MRRAQLLLAASITSLVLASPALAAGPLMERVEVSEIGLPDEFLTEACGVDVFTDITGHIINRVWTDAEGNPTRELHNFGIKLRIYSEFGSVNSLDVGVDRVTINPDGSVILSIVGNIGPITLPGHGRVSADTGITKLLLTFPDPEGDPVVEVLHEAGLILDDESLPICEVLAP